MAETAEQAAPRTAPGTYVAVLPVWHDGHEYQIGDAFPHEKAEGEELPTDAEVAALRRNGALKLPNELQAAEDVAAKIARQEAEIAALKEQLDALKSPKEEAAAAEAAPAEASEAPASGKAKAAAAK